MLHSVDPALSLGCLLPADSLPFPSIVAQPKGMTMNETKLTDSCHQFLLERLRDPAQAAAYLNAALEDEHEETFLLALCDVAEAQRLMPPKPETHWADVAATLRALSLRLAPR
jgi:hypothetical protein